MRLLSFLCLMAGLAHLAASTPVQVDQRTSAPPTTTTTSTPTTADEIALEKLAAATKISKDELRKRRQGLEKLRQLAGAKITDKVKAKLAKHKSKSRPKSSTPPNAVRKSILDINAAAGILPYMYQGDIELTSEQIAQRMNAESSNHTRKKRQMHTAAYSYWTSPVPYFFDAGLSDVTKNGFRAAVAYYQSKTCLSFSESSTPITDRNAIKVQTGNGCRSSVGRAPFGGPTDITVLTLAPGCETLRHAAHELMHALGYEHHQSRPDRDDYITTDPAIYNKFSTSEVDTQGLNYDFSSNMHYPSTTNGATVMFADDSLYQQSMDALVEPSFGDILALNKRHNCMSKCTSGASCYNGGYRNPANCNACICRAGFNTANNCVGPATVCGGAVSANSDGTSQTLSGQISSNQTGQLNDFTPVAFCDWHIYAPTGSVIEMSILSATGDCNSDCYWVGTEFSPKFGSTGSGFRLCCGAQSQTVVVSDSSVMVIRPYSRVFGTNSFQVSYRAVSPAQTPILTLYGAINYSGVSESFTVSSTCNNAPAAIFNDVASSLKLTSGCVRLFTAIDCAGTYKDYTGDTATLVPDGLNDQVSSISACPTASSTLTLFAAVNYAGASKTYTVTSACNNDVAVSFNDQTSSLKLTSGCVRLFAAGNCAGAFKDYFGDTATLAPDGMLNQASSFSGCRALPTLTLYDAINYAGSSKTYTLTGVCNNDIASSFNDVASSLKLNSGCVRLFTAIYCAGTSKDYYGDTATLVPDGMSDVASSFMGCNPSPTLTFFSDINYAGASKTYTSVTSTCNNDLASSFNDVSSSLKLTSGCVRIFSDINCGGISKDYIGDTATLVPDGMNDQASSFSSCPYSPTLTLYDAVNYAGASKTYTVTNVCNNDVALSFNDLTSSLKLTYGCVRLFAAGNCAGAYKEYTGNTATLDQDGMNDQASSFIGC